jgi:nicotinate-nucleotide adenylyltransferase
MARIGLLGGSFNPAHRAHRAISLAAMRQLGLDEVWWLVSPQNPLKSPAGMAPLAARLASARAAARHPRIRASALEAALGTRFAVDTAAALKHRFPAHDFIWIIGTDIVPELHRWRRWRQFTRIMPLALAPRTGYRATGSPAWAWLNRHRTSAKGWTAATLPAIITLTGRALPDSATALRHADPDWAARILERPALDD